MKPLPVVLLLAIAAAFCPHRGRAENEDLQLSYINLLPVSFSENNQPTGPAIIFAKELTAGMNERLLQQPVPVKRLLAMMRSEKLIVAAIGRIPEREDLMVWIGELYQDPLVIATLAPHPRIDTIEAARQIDRIGISLGSVSTDLLRQSGMTNIDVAVDYGTQAKKLKLGHINAWCGLRSAIIANWRRAGYDLSELQIGTPLQVTPIWIAASKQVPAAIIETMRQRYAARRSSADFATLFANVAQ